MEFIITGDNDNFQGRVATPWGQIYWDTGASHLSLFLLGE